MSKVSQVADGVYLIDTHQSRREGDAGFPLSSLVYYVDGLRPAIVETGPGSSISELLEAIGSISDPLKLCYAFLTHIHLDHGGGAGVLVKRLPNLTIVTHWRGARHLADPSRLIKATRESFGQHYEDQYGPILPVPTQNIFAAQDGDVVDLGGRSLTCVSAPGHASHHICLWDDKTSGLFCGEALGRPQSTVVAPVSGFDPDETLATIEKLRKLLPRMAFYSHGGSATSPLPLMDAVSFNMRAYREIILSAAKAGLSHERIVTLLEEYQKGHPAGERPVAHQVDDLVTWHMAYFRRRGII
jgi:glyoxylase-like metal-dependent hydrolase (beta-lactamase superfamily II)